MIFIVVVDYQMTREFYDCYLDFIEKYDLNARNELLSLNTSSFVGQTSLFKSNLKAVLVSNQYKVVAVDRKSRKSTALPTWFTEKYSPSIQQKGTFAKYTVPKLPNNLDLVYSKIYKINPSDMDRNQHTSNYSYMRFCFDAATEAVLYKGIFPGMPGTICGYNVQRCQAIYLQECRLCDVIEILVWQDSVKNDTLHFHINKLGNRENQESKIPLFRATFCFYINDSKL